MAEKQQENKCSKNQKCNTFTIKEVCMYLKSLSSSMLTSSRRICNIDIAKVVYNSARLFIYSLYTAILRNRSTIEKRQTRWRRLYGKITFQYVSLCTKCFWESFVWGCILNTFRWPKILLAIYITKENKVYSQKNLNKHYILLHKKT